MDGDDVTHPLVHEMLEVAGATLDSLPSQDGWRALLELVSRRCGDAERERLLFHSNPVPVFVFDGATFQFLEVNDAMVRIYGYTRDELLAMRMIDLKPPEDRPELVDNVPTTELGYIRRIGVRRHRRKDGAMLEMDVTSHSIQFAGRRAVLGIAVDVTLARQLEEQLRQAQKMDAIGQLAGGIAHDFNNILAVISANATLALDEIDAGRAATGELAEIATAAARAAALTRQLLAFSRKSTVQRKAMSLNAVVANLEVMLSRLVGEDIAIATLLSAQVGTIDADAGQLEQLLMNLVVNARDAMPVGGRIVIETANRTTDAVHAVQLGISAGNYVMLSVSDTGVGISDYVQGRMFEPFFTTKSVDKGTGLGLATVFGIVKQSRGGIEVSSEVGRGSTFRVYFPRVDRAISVASEPVAATPPRAPITVLLVEDDHQVRQVLHRYLTRWGYTLLEAPSAAAALALAHAHQGTIDLLLTDLVMPEMDGRALSRLLLAARPDAKVVIMSGYTEHPALHSAAIGPDECFMQKPFTPQSLADAITRVLAPRS